MFKALSGKIPIDGHEKLVLIIAENLVVLIIKLIKPNVKLILIWKLSEKNCFK